MVVRTKYVSLFLILFSLLSASVLASINYDSIGTEHAVFQFGTESGGSSSSRWSIDNVSIIAPSDYLEINTTWLSQYLASNVTGEHGNLTGLADDDHTQYLLVNGSRPMGGDLNMSGYRITDVGEIIMEGLITNNDITPAFHNLYDLGNTTNFFNAAYITNVYAQNIYTTNINATQLNSTDIQTDTITSDNMTVNEITADENESVRVGI